MRHLWFLFLISILMFEACKTTPQQQLVKKAGYKEGIFAKITTEKGEILAILEFEKAPLTVANFVGLAEGTIHNDIKPDSVPYYNGLKFHRVFKGYMAVGGCPKGNGTGHPGYLFKDEFHPDLKHDKPGILTMENNGPNSNGSQFIITMRESPVLDNKHSVFGHVISGMEIVNEIQQGDIMKTIEIIRIGKKAKAFNPMKVFLENGFDHMVITNGR